MTERDIWRLAPISEGYDSDAMDLLGTLEPVINFSTWRNGEEAKASASPIRLLTYAEMVAMPQADWLVEDVIPDRAKSVLYGPSNSFKSFHATDLGCSVSTGRSYHGKATTKRKVIYVANEGANGVGRKRIPAWMAAHKIPLNERGNIYLVTAETILPNETSRNNLLAAIRTIVEPDEEFFLIVDVMRGTMNGSENDDEAAHAWTSAAEILIAEGAALLTITHSPYSEDGRMRGHFTKPLASLAPSRQRQIISDMKCVTQDQWRDYFERRYADRSKDAARVAFKRGIESLTADGAIGCWTPHVWPAK